MVTFVLYKNLEIKINNFSSFTKQYYKIEKIYIIPVIAKKTNFFKIDCLEK